MKKCTIAISFQAAINKNFLKTRFIIFSRRTTAKQNEYVLGEL